MKLTGKSAHDFRRVWDAFPCHIEIRYKGDRHAGIVSRVSQSGELDMYHQHTGKKITLSFTDFDLLWVSGEPTSGIGHDPEPEFIN